MARRLGGTCGIPAYDDRTYVGVLAMTFSDGKVLPRRVVWQDGRWWDVLRSTEVGRWGRPDWGNVVVEYEVELGRRGCTRSLFLEEGRWFVGGRHVRRELPGTTAEGGGASIGGWMTDDPR